MRNLQKILALALALIMSFSLVVTANAAFSDEADITDTYNEAVNVLSQLEVFKGYTDGTYQPQKSITRAEVAAIIYRIATGDVTDTQVSIYSDWNRFTDVHAGEWWAGYINYCANAEYIKGYGNGKFGPDDPVTGYEALAMILRAVGYGKMDGEFQGSDWAVQTAARASTLKVTKNVQNSALLNSPATRELVAELLFRSILVPTVEYNQFSGYTENDTTLGYQSFGLEAIEGVVVANEFANLYDTQVLADGKTNLEVDGTVRTLDIGSAVTDVGEARYAYVSGSTVYALEDTGSNTVWEPENGVETDISTSAKFRTASGLTTNDTTEYYVNFGREGHFTSDYRLEISITFEPTKNITPERATALAVEQWFEEEYLDDTTVAKALGVDVTLGTNGQDTRTYHKIIRAEDEITQDQLDVIHGIFACADDADGGDSTNAYLGVQGDVYAGTRSAESGSTTNNRYVDLSDDISYRTFLRDYINSEAYDMSFEDTDNGEWLKIVDNDGDGIADYAFKTEYWLDKAVGSYTKSGNTILEYRLLDVEDREDNDGIIIYEDEIAVGDIVLYTDIDNKVIVRKAETAQATINSVSFRDETATATDGTVYEQSGIYNETRLDELLTTMDENVEYNLYFDAYGYVRAYEPAEGTRYGLLTEMYYSRGQNGQYVTNATLTAEMKAGSDAVDEFDVVNKNGNHFLLEAGLQNSSVTETWDDLHDELSKAAYDEWYQNVYKVNRNTEIVLQPALSHLSLRDGSYSNGESRTVDGIFDNVTTNVARYVKTADGEIRITSAAEYYTNERNQRMYYAEGDVGGAKHLPDDGGNRNYPAYAIDYIELDASNGIAEDQRRFEIAAGDYYANSNYVNAVDDTEFYVVTTNANDRRIGYFTGYENVVKINAEDIIAAYTVARNTEFDSEENDYWVADVIVIEVENYQRTYDSIALGYYNPYQTSGRVQAISTLNSETDPTKIDMIPDNNSWGTQWQDWGFYQVIDSRMDGDDLMADQIRKISWTDNGDDFSEYGIYAGVVRRLDAVNERGRYIDVDKYDDYDDYQANDSRRTSVRTSGAELYAIGAGSNGSGSVIRTEDLHLANSNDRSQIKNDHHIIWVTDKDNNVVFIVDVSYVDGSWKAPSWLEDLWQEIIDQQNAELNPDNPSVPTGAPVVTFYGETVRANTTDEDPFTVSWTDAEAANVTGRDNITVTNATGTGITGDATTIADVRPNKSSDQEYTLSVYGSNGNFYTYYLKQNAAGDDTTLSPDAADYITVAADNTVTLDVKTMSINEFIEAVTANDPNATVTYTFVNGQGTIDPRNYSQSMENVLAFTITVVAENGARATYEYVGAGVTKWDLRIPSNASSIGVYNAQTNEQLSGVYDGTPADGAVYSIPEGTSVYFVANNVGVFYGAETGVTAIDENKLSASTENGRTITDPVKITSVFEVMFRNTPTHVNIALSLPSTSNIAADLDDNTGAKKNGDVIYYENVAIGDTVTFTITATAAGTISGYTHNEADVVWSGNNNTVTADTQYTIKYTPKAGITDNIYLTPIVTTTP